MPRPRKLKRFIVVGPRQLLKEFDTLDAAMRCGRRLADELLAADIKHKNLMVIEVHREYYPLLAEDDDEARGQAEPRPAPPAA